MDEFIEMNTKGKRQAKSAADERKASDIVQEKARLAFNAYDRNRDGYLTKSEMKKTSKNMTEAQIDAVFEKYDKNKDGKLEFEEFKELMTSNAKNKNSKSKEQTTSTSNPSSSSTASSPIKE